MQTPPSLAIPGILFALILVVFLITTWSCKSTHFNPENHQDDYVTIGEGGGFAGIETSYHILTNGRVYKQSSIDTVQTELPKIDRKIISRALNNYKSLNLQTYQYEQPGNAYKFITFKTGEKKHRITWFDEKEVKPECIQIYQRLKNLIQNQ